MIIRQLLKNWLHCLAAKVLNKYKPRIVAITGSTGKTSTKEAILTALCSGNDPHIMGTIDNLNTEFGVTAAIIDPGFKGTSVGVKVRLTLRDIWYLTWRTCRLLIQYLPYPKVLVLELAADRPGDIRYFMSFIQPEVGIVTNIGDVHLEFFSSKAELVEEKGLLISNLKPKGLAILNQDDDFSKLISRKTTAKKIWISAEKPADWYARDIGFGSKGIHFSAVSGNRMVQVDLPVFGYQFIYVALFALAVGDYFRLSPELIAKRLSSYTTPKRRFEIIKLGQTIIIDDTYNANPTSVLAALKSLARLGVNRHKVAILGGMKELGIAHDKGHRNVGEYAAKTVDQLWVVGEGGVLIKEAALEAGLPPGQVRDFKTDAIPIILRDNSIVLVKGSQAMAMDKIVEQLKEHYERSH